MEDSAGLKRRFDAGQPVILRVVVNDAAPFVIHQPGHGTRVGICLALRFDNLQAFDLFIAQIHRDTLLFFVCHIASYCCKIM